MSRKTVYKPNAKVAPSRKAIVDDARGVLGMLPWGVFAAGSICSGCLVIRARCLILSSRSLNSSSTSVVMS